MLDKLLSAQSKRKLQSTMRTFKKRGLFQP